MDLALSNQYRDVRIRRSPHLVSWGIVLTQVRNRHGLAVQLCLEGSEPSIDEQNVLVVILYNAAWAGVRFGGTKTE